jgi:hypothetical protein
LLGDDVRGERAGRNQRRFGEATTQVLTVREPGFPVIEFVCECVDLDCCERIRMTGEEYRRVRIRTTRFAVAVGHAGPRRLERLVRGCERYEVVETIDTAR